MTTLRAFPDCRHGHQLQLSYRVHTQGLWELQLRYAHLSEYSQAAQLTSIDCPAGTYLCGSACVDDGKTCVSGIPIKRRDESGGASDFRYFHLRHRLRGS
jgi:hypothetical protein